MSMDRTSIGRLIAVVIGAALACASCGYGPSIRTLEASCSLDSDGARLLIDIPRGSIDIEASGAAGSRTVTGRLDIYNRGVSGITFEPASKDDILFELKASAESLSVNLGPEAEKPNLYYALTIHVPSDYAFWSLSAQEPNSVVTGEGEVTIKGLKGGPMGSRDFYIWAEPPMDSFSHPSMTIEDVDGVITASAWGPMTVSGCRAVSSVFGSGSGDKIDLTLGTTAISVEALIHSRGHTYIRLSRQSNFTFLNEVDSINAFAVRGVRNKGEPVIKGPTDFDEYGIIYQKIQTGDGSVGQFEVYTIDNVIEYSLYD